MTTRAEIAARERVVERLRELEFPCPLERRALAQVIEDLESRLGIVTSTPLPRLRWERREAGVGVSEEAAEGEGHQAIVTCTPAEGGYMLRLQFLVRGGHSLIDESQPISKHGVEEQVKKAKIRLGLRLRRRMKQDRS